MPKAAPRHDRIDAGSTWTSGLLSVVPHDPGWSRVGRTESERLRQLLAPWLSGAVEHVGSTAVPGLAARPVVDLQALVRDTDAMVTAAPVLQLDGWHGLPVDLDARHGRRFFVKIIDRSQPAHLELIPAGSARWFQQLAFRDALRGDPALAGAYGRLKVRLNPRHEHNRTRYGAAKRRFVREVLARPIR